MKRFFHNNHTALYYENPATISVVVGFFFLIGVGILQAFIYGYEHICTETAFLNPDSTFIQNVGKVQVFVLALAVVTFVVALLLHFLLPTRIKIKRMVQRGLFYYPLGNPLKLKEGELLPKVKVREIEKGKYEIKIRVTAFSLEDLSNVSSNISSSINNRYYDRYAVISRDSDIAMNWVKFVVEDVTIDRKLHVTSVEELKTGVSTKLIVQDNTYIDLTTSGSILVAGKTRSGKTTGIISLLLQALQYGRDSYFSEILIIDPKRAELSRLPHTITLDENGEGMAIIEALQRFENTIVSRQKILNDLSEKTGDAVKWWDAGMHVSFCFIDEYVSARSIFPTKADKDHPDYTLANFDGLVKRIVTMGASAGCYIIISIAEASVESGGLPAMIRSAMSTRICFKPTMAEARLMWDSEKLKDLPERIYKTGEAFFTSTNGVNENVTYVSFPYMDFKVYHELGRLLKSYYAD